MQIMQRLNTLWNQQYGHPNGVIGWLVGERMILQHRPETLWTIEMLDIQPTDTLLEAGFGAGRGIKLAADKALNGHIIGIDHSEMMVRAATRRNAQAVKTGRVTLTQGDIAALPFEDHYFDKIMTIHTVYFWPDPQVLNELCRVLKPGGRIIITLSTGKMNAQGEVEIWAPLQSILEEQIVPGMQQAGFKVVRLEQGPNSRQYTSVAVLGEK